MNNRTLKLAALLAALLMAAAPMGALAGNIIAIEPDAAPGQVEAVAQDGLSGLELDIPQPVSEPVPARGEAPAGNAAVAINKRNFPDPVFRAYVKERFDTDGNGKLSTSEIDAVTYIFVYNMGIASLRGVERFTNLETLLCASNKLKSLNVSRNRKLQMLSCSQNALTKLDVSRNPGLTYLSCDGNKLKRLSVGKCRALTDLDCSENALKKLDVAKNTALQTLFCSQNALTRLTLGSKKQLKVLNAWGNRLKTIDLKGCARLKAMAKKKPSFAIGETVWWENGGGDSIAIDGITRLTAGSKVLYKGA